MKELNQEQHIQLLQFMSLMQTCKTEEELQALKEQYFNIPRYEFLQDYISEKSENQSLSSYKTSLIYEMDKYQHDYKIVYGENFPAYKKETMPNNKADYTVIHLLNEISECDDIEAYQKLMEEKNRFYRVKIEALSHEFTGIYFSNENELPTNIILNSPESNFNARRQLVEAGYSPFTLPSVEDVRENGFEWLHEEISHFKETLNPNFIEQETQRNQEPEFNEQEYEEAYDDFIEQMDANGGMSSMAAEADYNGSYVENEDIDEVQQQMDMDNGLIDENGNEILYDGPENETEEDFEKYIHSEEFISKFGDWEKANRLEKLKESESLTIDNQIIIHGNNVTNEINDLRQNPSSENLKILTKYVNELGKEMVQNLRFEQNLTKYENPKFIVSNDNKSYSFNFSGIKETSRHNIFQKGHIEGIANIPEIIEASFYIGTEKNEDNRKPELSKFHYYGLGIKLDNEDFTAKVVFTENKQGEVYYDQSLSNIEKGRLIDIIQMDKMPENLSPLITQRESEQEEVLNPLISQENLKNNPETVLPHIQGRDSSEVFSKSNNQPPLMREEKSNPPKYYDKRLMNICQVPQMPYLEKNIITGKWQPTKEAVEAVKNGTLFIEKHGQKYVMNDSVDVNKIQNIGTTEKKENSLNTADTNQKVENVISNELNLENNIIPVENNEIEQKSEPQNEPQNYENNNSNSSAPRPRNAKELHQFFINNPYTSGTPVPTIAIRNEQTGHSTFIEGYEFARFEDIGKPNPAFRDENGKQIKPDGQTVVLTKPAFKEVIDEETGEKKLVPDDKNRKFIRISRDLYEQAIKNSEIIAKRNPKTEQEKQKMLDDYLEADHLDEKKQRANTASNFWHNYKAGVMTIANNKQEAMAFAKRLVNEMIPSEREKFAAMVRKYEKIRGTDGKHLSYDQRIIDFYDNMGLKITNNSIWRDHVDEKYNTLDAIKQNTEVFDKEGQLLDKTCRMKVGDTIKMSVTVDSALSNKKIQLPIQEYRLVAHSKDNNSVALISADGKQKIIKNREDFIKEVQKVEHKLIKKQQKQDRYESISM